MLSPTSPTQLMLLKDIENWFMPIAADVSALADTLKSPQTSNLCNILRNLRTHQDLIGQYTPFPKVLRQLYLKLYVACMRFISSVHPLSTSTSNPCSCNQSTTPELSSAPHGSYETRLQIVEVIASMILEVMIAVPPIDRRILGEPRNIFWPRSVDDIAPLGAKKLLLSIEKWAMVLPQRPAADLLECYQRFICLTNTTFDPPLISSATIYRTYLTVARQPLNAFKALQAGTLTDTHESYARIRRSSWTLAAMGQLVFKFAWERKNAPREYHLRLYSMGCDYVTALQPPHFPTDKTIAPYPHVQTWVHLTSFMFKIFPDLPQSPSLHPDISAEFLRVERVPNNLFYACHVALNFINVLSRMSTCCAPKCNIILDHIGNPSPQLGKCTGCRMYAYCGRECQVKAWKEHKIICKALGRIVAADTDDLLGHLLCMPLDAAVPFVVGSYFSERIDDFALLNMFWCERLDHFDRQV